MSPLTLILLYLLALNLLTLALFWWDKRCAIERRWRIPESTLLTLCLIGGSLGAKTGQGIFRHKTRKEPFRTSLNAIAVLHIGFLGALVLPEFRASVMNILTEATSYVLGLAASLIAAA
ncbi:putative membrane protein [Roseovarius mucosus DSM 17069]|jgi:uncharacterized membrane protein YsdA (DUF1294 family)|uniref:Putative membrane protein n=1 Tax=Roseovarius mucosus DSM 17069 TaxID=1288298 RepID=A0A0A0HMP6_9RHOB|nr:DUF1294 domain-containing protein [Roseovarius mucosus]KGM87919.1 putative membrane protein [Roseovarius mucosus DSM 17069]